MEHRSTIPEDRPVSCSPDRAADDGELSSVPSHDYRAVLRNCTSVLHACRLTDRA